jgi:hypothetical protein
MTWPKHFLVSFSVTITVAFAAIITYVALIDPYLVVWRLNDSHATHLDFRMRTAKPLQVLKQRGDILFLGSSRIQRGIDPALLNQVDAYNFGISGLLIHEARKCFEHALLVSTPQELYFGLDMFMFDADCKTRPGFDENTGALEGLLASAIGAFTGLDALENALARHNTTEPNPDGISHANGYQEILARRGPEPALANRMAYVLKVRISGEQEFDELIAMLALAERRGIRVTLFFNPLHESYEREFTKAGKDEEVTRWKERIIEIAQQRKARLFDFTVDNPATRIALDPQQNLFLDADHYTALHGAALMLRMGLPVNSETHAVIDRLGLSGIGREIGDIQMEAETFRAY